MIQIHLQGAFDENIFDFAPLFWRKKSNISEVTKSENIEADVPNDGLSMILGVSAAA